MAAYYNNALDFLADEFTCKGDELPAGITNPMRTGETMPSKEHALAKVDAERVIAKDGHARVARQDVGVSVSSPSTPIFT